MSQCMPVLHVLLPVLCTSHRHSAWHEVFAVQNLPSRNRCTVLTMIVVVLRIRQRRLYSHSYGASLIYRMRCMTVYHRFQSHFQTEGSLLLPFFKAKTISDIYCFLFCDILSSGDKSDPIAFCISGSHLIDLFLGKSSETLPLLSHSQK